MATGGIIPYSFVWELDGGALVNDPNVEDVAVGIHTLMVTDYNGCTNEMTASVAPASGTLLTTSITIADELCEGDDTGALLATASGGNAPYTYQWNYPLFTLNEVLEPIAAPGGEFTVFVEDMLGCSDQSTFVFAPNGPEGNVALNIQMICQNGSLGSAILSVEPQGLNPIFEWYDNLGQTIEDSEVVENLPIGIYSVHYQDDSRCFIENFEVSQLSSVVEKLYWSELKSQILIPLSNYSHGLYAIRIEVVGKTLFTSKLIISE